MKLIQFLPLVLGTALCVNATVAIADVTTTAATQSEPTPERPHFQNLGLLVTQIPERPVEAVSFRIEVPSLYVVDAASMVVHPALAGSLDLSLSRGPEGSTKIVGLMTSVTPIQLSGYILRFRIWMQDPSGVTLPLHLRSFVAWLDWGFRSRHVDVELLGEDGTDGNGELP